MKRGEMFCKGRRGETETVPGEESGEEGSVPFSSRCRIIQNALCPVTIICELHNALGKSIPYIFSLLAILKKLKVDPFLTSQRALTLRLHY